MNTLFGNNVVNNHGENKENKTATNNFQQSSSGNANYRNDSVSAQPAQFAGSSGDSPTASLDPIDFDNLPDFRSIEYKDGHVDGGDEDWIDRKKCTMAEIEGQPIVIRSIHPRQSKLYDGNEYISINFVNQQGEECFCNTSGHTIKKQISEKNMQYPFKATIKAVPKKDNPNMKYYKLS